MDWLQHYIFPAEAKTVAPAFVRAGTELAALEMIRSGTTTYADMYHFEEEIARVTRVAGLRGVLGETVIGFPSPDAKTPAEALSRAERFIQEFADDPLITPAVAPHSMYLVDKEVLLACRALAVKHGKPLLIHLAETEDELKTARDRFQDCRPCTCSRSASGRPGSLPRTAIWVTDEDIALLAQAQVGVSHNPESNMKLASGTAPVTQYLKPALQSAWEPMGRPATTTSTCSRPCAQTAFLHKLASRDPRALPAATVLELATLGGARGSGWSGRSAHCERGKHADLLVVGVSSAARHRSTTLSPTLSTSRAVTMWRPPSCMGRC